MAKAPDFTDMFAHFPQTVSEELARYVTDTALVRSRYLFVWREKGFQIGYCTHCNTEIPVGLGSFYYKHNEQTQCLKCQSTVTVKTTGRGRSTLVDDAYVVWYEKSLIDSTAIVARGMRVWRDYRGDFRQVETRFETEACYLFAPVTAKRKAVIRMLQRDWRGDWCECKSAHSLIDNVMKYKRCYCSEDSVKAAVHGTPLQYSTWTSYRDTSYDFVRFFTLAAKYPCVEYLTKLGFDRIVKAKLLGHSIYRVINWRGKSIEKVLGLTKIELRQLKEIPGPIDALTMYSHRWLKNRGMHFTLPESYLLRDLTEGYYHQQLLTALRELDVAIHQEQLLRYLLKQMRREDARHRYGRSAGLVLSDWRDYLKFSRELGKDLSRVGILFPNNLHRAHEGAVRKLKVRHDREINQKIANRVPKLTHLSFSTDEFLLRPAQSSLELFDEGKALKHCVGTYADRYAKGETDIFVLRRVSEPNKPFYTMEVRDGRIAQCRGLGNCAPTDDVQAFVELFIKHRFSTRRAVQGKSA